jgi:branched-chain amino acid transport system ATP-binding protein
MLELREVRGGYGAVEVLRGIDLRVQTGEIVALLGSNGAGKSTLNNTICGLYPAFSGTVRFETLDITRAPSAQIVSAGLIQVPEGRRVFPNMTVRENLELGSYRRARMRRSANLDRVFVLFPRLLDREKQKAGTLSGGEQQMLAIGRGLMAEPRLLILDEPSLGLSPRLVEELFQLIRRLNQEGLAILLVEQNVGQSLEIAHRAYVMENGAIAFQGTPSALLADPELRRAYLGI